MGGEHLHAFCGSAEETIQRLPELIKTTVAVRVLDEQREYNKAHSGEGAFIASVQPDMPASLLVLSEAIPATKQLLVRSLYPFLRDGVPKPLEILDMKPDEDDVEGVLECVDHNGFTVCFFDPLFACHRNVYRSGRKFEFSMAALACAIEEVKETTFRITEGPALEMERQRRLAEDPTTDVSAITDVEFSMAEMRTFLPDDNGADGSFQTVVEESEFFSVDDAVVCKMRVILMRPNDEDFLVDLYATSFVLNGYRPKKGDVIRGVLWLQGYALRPVEDPANWGDQLAPNSVEHFIERYARFDATMEVLIGQHVGVRALGASIAQTGWDVTVVENPQASPLMPTLLAMRAGHTPICIWVRAFIAGQEPEASFTTEEIAERRRPELEGKADTVFVSVLCKDIGEGYCFEVRGIEDLEALTGPIGMIDYLAKRGLPGSIGAPEQPPDQGG